MSNTLIVNVDSQIAALEEDARKREHARLRTRLE